MWLARLLLLISTLTSCALAVEGDGYVADYEDARLSAIAAWEEKIGPIAEQTYNVTTEFRIEEVGDIPCNMDTVPPGFRVVGCVKFKRRLIWISALLSEYQKASTAVHEWIHVLARHELGSSNSLHTSPRLWETVGGMDSIEAWGCAGLAY